MTFRIGNYFPDNDQAPLSKDESQLVDQFHDLYYRRWMAGADTINLSWFGYQVLKCPLDLWIYQELIVRTRPDVIVETGTRFGGSALFIASILDQIGHGRVITIDLDPQPNLPDHPRITYLAGSSTDPSVVEDVTRRVKNETVMVILDSDHRVHHVYEEIMAYEKLVSIGGYLIVEDTNVNGHPTLLEYGPGPMEAATRFLAENKNFVVDERCQRFMMTLNPKGYLKRIA